MTAIANISKGQTDMSYKGGNRSKFYYNSFLISANKWLVSFWFIFVKLVGFFVYFIFWWGFQSFSKSAFTIHQTNTYCIHIVYIGVLVFDVAKLWLVD